MAYDPRLAKEATRQPNGRLRRTKGDGKDGDHLRSPRDIASEPGEVLFH